MAVKAFILVDTSPGKAREVAAKLRQVAGISRRMRSPAHTTSSRWPRRSDVSALGELVVQKIQSVAGVNRSLTSIVAD